MGSTLPKSGLNVEAVQRYIEEAGTSIGGFGGTWIGGYSAQQEPAELAQLIYFLLGIGHPFHDYLEIGAAAGGTARLLDDFLKLDHLYVIDLNNDGMLDHEGVPLWKHRAENIPQAVEWVGDSHSTECRHVVDRWGPFDLILIDGDHSYAGIRADTVLAVEHAADGAILVYHDVCAPQTSDCHRWAAELNAGAVPGLTHLETFGDRLGLGVYQWTSK